MQNSRKSSIFGGFLYFQILCFQGYTLLKDSFGNILITFNRDSKPLDLVFQGGFLCHKDGGWPVRVWSDLASIGHYGTEDLQITVKNSADFEKAKPLLERAYNEA